MGNGCTSGHGVMGIARLSLRSFVAVFCFLGTGILTACLMHYYAQH
ncbi:YeeE/YedE family protein [Neokomagataea tanensis]